MRARVTLAFLLVLGGRAIAAVAPLLYKRIVDALSDPVVAIPGALLAAYGLAYAGGQVSNELRRYVFAPVWLRAARQMALRLFQHLMDLPLAHHLDRKTGGLTRIIDRGVYALTFLLDIALFSLLPTLIELALVATILWHFYGADLAFTVMVTICSYGLFTFWMTGRQIAARREMNSRDVAASVTAVDGLLNYETVKYFTAEARTASRYDEARRYYEAAAISSQRVEAGLGLGQAMIVAAGLIVVMWMASSNVSRGNMTIGDFVLIIAYLIQLYAPLDMMAAVYGQIRQSLTDAEAMTEVLALSPECPDAPDAAREVAASPGIAFDNVHFAYDGRRPILSGVDFVVPAGKKVALVGATGGGKSTVTRLLFRFYDVDQGAICLGERDIRQITRTALRRAIGIVPQDTILFSTSLRANIAFGREDASDSEIEEAARLARLHDFILGLPDGYDTIVGERGLKLSGGERQRVAIARMILKQPSILILDEATSALDNHTERDVQQSLKRLAAGRTTLVIAHRLSTIVDADEILVLDGGRIAERGTHTVLLEADGLYAMLWRQQLRIAA